MEIRTFKSKKQAQNFLRALPVSCPYTLHEAEDGCWSVDYPEDAVLLDFE